MKKYPEPTVSAIILNKENKILLCKSHKWQNKFVIPGGHIEYGERMENALKREILEETGLIIYDLRLLSIQECIQSDSFSEEKHFISIDYLCRTNNDTVKLNDEADSFVWAEIKDILNYELGGYIRPLFNEYIKGNSSNHQCTIFYNYVNETCKQPTRE